MPSIARCAPDPATTRLRQAEVVAGLTNNGSARLVARAAVREAERLGTMVRFLHVTTAHAQLQGGDPGDTAFAAALEALHHHSRVRCAFEVASGDPGRVLVERSRGAHLLVLGDDGPREADVTAYCREHAGCIVHTVAHPDSAFVDSARRLQSTDPIHHRNPVQHDTP